MTNKAIQARGVAGPPAGGGERAPVVVLVTGPPGSGKSTLASAVARSLGGCTVLGWDWVMGALTPFPAVQDAVRSLGVSDYRRLGWSLMWSVAEEQLRERTSVVLDGVAREGEVAETRQLAVRCGAAAVVVGLTCSDTTVLRRRVDGRERRIPGWHELTWEEVARVHSQWLVSDSIDLAVDTADRPEVDELARTVVALLDP